LLAEDDPTIRDRQFDLRQLGWEVTVVETDAGSGPLQEGDRPVLMDIQMPEMDGIEATRLIRQLEGEQGEGLAFCLTAHARPENRQ
jgi:CheY-like chemotaxis protein